MDDAELAIADRFRDLSWGREADPATDPRGCDGPQEVCRNDAGEARRDGSFHGSQVDSLIESFFVGFFFRAWYRSAT